MMTPYEALEAAIARCQMFLDTFGDLGGCTTQADINDWHDAASTIHRTQPSPEKAALERIALLDEADGHELTADHARLAVSIATAAIGQHPSEILAAHQTAPSPPAPVVGMTIELTKRFMGATGVELWWYTQAGQMDRYYLKPSERGLVIDLLLAAAVNHQSPSSGERDRALEEAAKWHDWEADNAKRQYADLDRYGTADEAAGWRAWKDKEDTHHYCAAGIRAMKSGDRDHNKANAIVLSQTDYLALLDAIENPKPNPALVKLLRSKAPWEPPTSCDGNGPDIEERLWNALHWIDRTDPELTAAAEKKFGLDMHRRRSRDNRLEHGRVSYKVL